MSTHKIISMERGETRGSKSPMWRCRTEDGIKVNVFMHELPERDTAHLFDEAGYWPFMEPMKPGDQITWNKFPIIVTLIKNREYFEVVAVELCEDTRPDERLLPEKQLYQRAAIKWAQSLLSSNHVVIWDTETTGLTKEDEIIEIGAVNLVGDTLIDLKLRPIYIDRVARVTAINGFSPEALQDAPGLWESWPHIYKWLSASTWAIFNAAFDSEMLEYGCRRAGLQPIFPTAMVDVMEMFARFYGDYDPQRQAFKPKSLQFAADYFGILQSLAHTALDDALTTLKVVRALADAEAGI